MMSFRFLVFIVINPITTSKIVSCEKQLHSFPLKSGESSLSLSIGTPKNTVRFDAIDQALDYSTIALSQFNMTKSTTCNVLNGDYDKSIIEEVIYFKEREKDKVIPMKWIVANTNHTDFGLAFNFKDEGYSITHALKANSLIYRLTYSIAKFNEVLVLTFGGILDILEDLPKGNCKVDPNYSTWGCQLTKAIIQDKNTLYTFDKSFYALFQVKQKNINVPLAFLRFLKEIALLPYFMSQDCYEMKSSYTSVQYIYCLQKIIPKLPNITLVFETVSLTIPMLFDLNLDTKYIYIESDLKQTEHWVFGAKHFEYFHTLFDYENSLITFYGESGIKEIDTKKKFKASNKKNKLLFVLVSMLLLVNLVLLIIFKRNTRTSKHYGNRVNK